MRRRRCRLRRSALAVTEIVSVIGSRHRPSVVSAVASRFVDLTAVALKDFAVSVFGTNDKAALLTGVVIVSLLLGALLGISGARRRWVRGRRLHGVRGLGRHLRRGRSAGSTTVLVIASLVGAIVGIVAADRVAADDIHATGDPARVDRRARPAGEAKVADRRTFLTVAGGIGARRRRPASRALRGTSVATKSRAATVLPPAGHSVPVPADATVQRG